MAPKAGTAPRDGGAPEVPRSGARNTEQNPSTRGLDDTALAVPDLDPDADSLTLATALADAGFYVMPTRASEPRNAGSRLGKGWPAQSSRDPKVIAAWFVGSSDRVAIHCGRSGLIVADVDHAEHLTPELDRAIKGEAPPFHSTRPDEPTRGHYLFAQPAGRRLGNRAGGTGKDWGEWRGTNGIVLVGGDGREFVSTGPVPVLPAEVAALLPDVGEQDDAVSDAELERFTAAHRLALDPRSLDSILGAFETAAEDGGSRHNAAVDAACWAVREAIEGRFSAGKALHRLESLFVEVMADSHGGRRTLDRKRAEDEFRSAVAWAVGQEWHPDGAELPADGLPDPTADIRARADRIAVDDRKRILRRDEIARRELAAEKRAGRPSIESGILDDLDEIEPPRMLLGSLIPEDAIGILSGRTGSYKSFLAVAWACAIGTGTAWLGRSEFAVSGPLKVLYVAAEGARGAAARLRAWEAHTGLSRHGKVRLYPKPIKLDDPDQAAELAEHVAKQGYRFIVIDTLHRSTSAGSEENSSGDFGALFDAMAVLRDEHGCGGLLVDHAGHDQDWRPRGTSAKLTDPDYLLSVTYPGEGAGAEHQRKLTVQKLKDEEVSGRWSIMLSDVADHLPVVTIGDVATGTALHPPEEWWSEAPRVPDDLGRLLVKAAVRNRGVQTAGWIWRLLVVVDGDNGRGLTTAATRRMLCEMPTEHQPPTDESTVRKAVRLLVDTEVCERDGERVRLSAGGVQWSR